MTLSGGRCKKTTDLSRCHIGESLEERTKRRRAINDTQPGRLHAYAVPEPERAYSLSCATTTPPPPHSPHHPTPPPPSSRTLPLILPHARTYATGHLSVRTHTLNPLRRHDLTRSGKIPLFPLKRDRGTKDPEVLVLEPGPKRFEHPTRLRDTFLRRVRNSFR